jgi:AcrR family transcriptional regulator
MKDQPNTSEPEQPESARIKAVQTKSDPYHHGDLHHTLIQIGLEMLSEGGASSLDLRKVARKAGVSHAAPYRHFADKQALVAAITEEGFHLLADQIQTALATTNQNNALEQLQSIANAYVGFAQEHPWLMREMFSGLTLEREAFPDLHAAYKTVFTFYAEVLARGQQQGSIIEGDPPALAGVLWSMLYGLAMLIIENQIRPYVAGEGGVERMTRFTMQTLYNGLGRKT